MEQRFKQLAEYTFQMGVFAKENQSKIHRKTKADGTYITETDLTISDNMIKMIGELYPEANVITEENNLTVFNSKAPLTFIVDPIDGTTAYSRGMPTWAVSVGIIDAKRTPIGAIISLPRFGYNSESSFFVFEPNSNVVYLNGKPFEISMEGHDEMHDIITGDRTWKCIKMPDFSCKLRSLCSSVVDMISQILFVDFAATINDAGCYAWDIAGTDAILSHYGIHTILSDGTNALYTDDYLVKRKAYPLPVYAATPKVLEFMLKNFTVKIR